MGMWTLLLLMCFGFMLCDMGFKNVTLLEAQYERQMGGGELPLSYYIMLMIGSSGGGLAVGSILEMHKRIEAQKKG